MSYVKLIEEKDDHNNSEKLKLVEKYYNILLAKNHDSPLYFKQFKNTFNTNNLFKEFDNEWDKKIFTKLILNKEEELYNTLKIVKEKYENLLIEKKSIFLKKVNLKKEKWNIYGLMKSSNLLIRLKYFENNFKNEKVFWRFILDGEIKTTYFLSENFSKDYIL